MGIIKDFIRKALPAKPAEVKQAEPETPPQAAAPQAGEKVVSIKADLAARKAARLVSATAAIENYSSARMEMPAPLLAASAREAQAGDIALPDSAKQSVQDIMAKLGLQQRDSSTASAPREQRFAAASVQEGVQLSLVPSAGTAKSKEAGGLTAA